MIDSTLFRKFALQLVDAEYKWGKENPHGSDCSGTVCYPLIMNGYKIRTTADELYSKIFTEPVSQGEETDLGIIMSVFYVMKSQWRKLDGTVMPAGTVRHVTPVVGRYVVLDADWTLNRLVLKTAKQVRLEKEVVGAKAVWRKINLKAIELYNGKLYYSPDKWFETLNGSD